MKKNLLFVIITICTLQITVSAQKSRVGMVGGYTLSNFSGELGGTDIDYKSRAGFTLGLIVEAPLGKGNFSFQPGLHYMQKGAVTAESNKQLEYIALRYIELQGNILYNTSGDKTGGTFFLGAGPTFSVAVPSKSVIRDKKEKRSVETNLSLGNEPADSYTSADYGANVLAGFRFKKGFMFSFNYTIGIANILPDSPDPAKANDVTKNGSFGLRIGVLINNPK